MRREGMLEWTASGHLEGNRKRGIEHGHKIMGNAKLLALCKDAYSVADDSGMMGISCGS